MNRLNSLSISLLLILVIVSACHKSDMHTLDNSNTEISAAKHHVGNDNSSENGLIGKINSNGNKSAVIPQLLGYESTPSDNLLQALVNNLEDFDLHQAEGVFISSSPLSDDVLLALVNKGTGINGTGGTGTINGNGTGINGMGGAGAANGNGYGSATNVIDAVKYEEILGDLILINQPLSTQVTAAISTKYPNIDIGGMMDITGMEQAYFLEEGELYFYSSHTNDGAEIVFVDAEKLVVAASVDRATYTQCMSACNPMLLPEGAGSRWETGVVSTTTETTTASGTDYIKYYTNDNNTAMMMEMQ